MLGDWHFPAERIHERADIDKLDLLKVYPSQVYVTAAGIEIVKFFHRSPDTCRHRLLSTSGRLSTAFPQLLRHM